MTIRARRFLNALNNNSITDGEIATYLSDLGKYNELENLFLNGRNSHLLLGSPKVNTVLNNGGYDLLLNASKLTGIGLKFLPESFIDYSYNSNLYASVNFSEGISVYTNGANRVCHPFAENSEGWVAFPTSTNMQINLINTLTYESKAINLSAPSGVTYSVGVTGGCGNFIIMANSTSGGRFGYIAIEELAAAENNSTVTIKETNLPSGDALNLIGSSFFNNEPIVAVVQGTTITVLKYSRATNAFYTYMHTSVANNATSTRMGMVPGGIVVFNSSYSSIGIDYFNLYTKIRTTGSHVTPPVNSGYNKYGSYYSSHLNKFICMCLSTNFRIEFDLSGFDFETATAANFGATSYITTAGLLGGTTIQSSFIMDTPNAVWLASSGSSSSSYNRFSLDDGVTNGIIPTGPASFTIPTQIGNYVCFNNGGTAVYVAGGQLV